MRYALAFFAFLVPALFNLAYGQATISDGSITVTVNELGVMTAVPAGGIQTYDGKIARIQPGDAEWFGVSYDGPLGHGEFVGTGTQVDWTKRADVRPVSFHATASEAWSVVRAGDLEVTTHIHFDPDGPYLLANAELTNVGTQTIKNIYYTREWSSPTEAGRSLTT